jgi:hypothetical protein
VLCVRRKNGRGESEKRKIGKNIEKLENFPNWSEDK